MKCLCGYRDGLEEENTNDRTGLLGSFFHSTFADLERRAGMSKTEKARIYGCPACGGVFIEPTSK